MKTSEQSFISDDGKSIHLYHWAPEKKPVACILIAHGMAEHAKRYERFAKALTDAHYDVWAPDHRGHGQTASEGELGYFADKDGFRRVVDDLHAIMGKIKRENPGLPVILFGHSMGSFLSQGFIALYGDELKACILSGTAGNGGALISAGKICASIGCVFKGRRALAPFMDKMSFGSYNNAFKPNRTPSDWLSRDDEEVDKYIKDPLCGFICTYGFFKDFLSGLKWIHKKSTMSRIPKNLPIYLIAGEKDPVGAASGSVDRLFNDYKALGINDVNEKLYPDARHEILNDFCKDEVTSDVLNWLSTRI